MQKLIFIQDSNYSSNLYTNTIEFLSSSDKLSCSAVEANQYKIKMMPYEEAIDILATNPSLINAKEYGCGKSISFVSFGGAVYHLDLDKMIAQADKHHISSLVSYPTSSFSEATQLATAKLVGEEIRSDKGFVFIYASLIKLEDTPIYYLVLNHSLVQSISSIEIENEKIHVQQIKGTRDSIRDSLFSPEIRGAFGQVIPCDDSDIHLDFFTTAVAINKNIFHTLKFDINAINCSYQKTNKGFLIKKNPNKNAFIQFTILNHFLDNKISSSEKLRWEYTLLDK